MNGVVNLLVLSCLIKPDLQQLHLSILLCDVHLHTVCISLFSQHHSREPSRSVSTDVSSGNLPLNFLLNKSSAGLLPVVLCTIPLYTVTYFLSSFCQSSPPD